ncbi:hypothetical protein BJ138DRAFT_1118655 [Hygrophoropsis aurantiaca]|uniref:Uncharacterized protein n=1 Tax=Hygrophoropsis aurantiaca TaxID=72124 RepID=A0ACB7ZVH9_9AGAM|nr:hypothetical protein BJ138DRAFT_1118655 [Hygrophoropsis aurantiaca]
MPAVPPTPVPIIAEIKFSSKSQLWFLQKHLGSDDKLCEIKSGCIITVYYHHKTPPSEPITPDTPPPKPAATGLVERITGVDDQNIRFRVHIVDPSRAPHTIPNPPPSSHDQAAQPTNNTSKPPRTHAWTFLNKTSVPTHIIIETITLFVPIRHCKLSWGASALYHLVRPALSPPPPSVPIMASRKDQDTLYNLQCRKVVRDKDGLTVYKYDREGRPRPQVEYIGGEW